MPVTAAEPTRHTHCTFLLERCEVHMEQNDVVLGAIVVGIMVVLPHLLTLAAVAGH